MKTLNIQLTPEEVNKVLTALGNIPYVQVFELIEKIKKQAESQFEVVQNSQKVNLDKEYVEN